MRSGWVVAAAALASAAAAQGGSLLAELDANNDGQISHLEYIEGRNARFDQLDHNRDGRIDLSDFPRAQRRATLANRAGELIASADLNRDNAVTRQELSVAGTPLFNRADRDADGFLDPEEQARLQTRVRSPR